MHRTHAFFTLAFAAGLAVATQPAAAQGFLMPSTPEKGVWLETAHTSFKGFEASFPSTVWYLSGRLPLSPRISAVVDVPFSYAKAEFASAGKETNSVFGNPYVGVEYAASSRLLLEAGTRAPLNTADEESFADVIAFLADPLRPEAFLENLVPASAAATFQQALPGGLGLRARGGVAALFWTGEESRDADAAIDYGLVGTYSAGPAQLALGVAGRWYATNDDGNLAETSLHQAGLSADVRVGGVRPGVSLRVPLDSDYREVVKSTVGLYLQVPLR